MPDASELPESIRSLAHRQAVVLRDETWDEDDAEFPHVSRIRAVFDHSGSYPHELK